MITKRKQHDKEQVVINYNWRNAHGRPALVRKSDGKWIQWISKKDEHLVFKLTL
jgi:hypothetical protein